jgi:outer membrane murein-binding lipoprotein Lpp
MRFTWTICRGAAAGLVGLTLLAGCASEQAVPKTASSADPLASQARRMRAADVDRDGTGLSSQSRDIEKDLGYR